MSATLSSELVRRKPATKGVAFPAGATLGVLMSAKCYRIVTVNGLAGAIRYLLVELAEDGATETLLPHTFDTIEEAETARAALQHQSDSAGSTGGGSPQKN